MEKKEEAWRDFDCRMHPVFRFSSTNSLHASSSWGFNKYNLVTFGMVKVSVGRENIKRPFREDISIVSILGRKDSLVLLGGDDEFGGEGGLLDVSFIKGDGLLDPVDMGVIFCQPRHSQDYLGMSQPYNHEGQVFFKGGDFTVDFSGGGDASLLVGSAINVKCLKGLDQMGWEEETLDEGGVDRKSVV